MSADDPTGLDSPRAAAQRVLWHYVDTTDPYAVPGGGFVEALVAAFAAADAVNRRRLGRAFPAYGEVFAVLNGDVDPTDPDTGLPRDLEARLTAGVEQVRRMAAGDVA